MRRPDAPFSYSKDASLLLAAQTAFTPDHPTRIGVAVSGGGDSMAALHLMCRAAGQDGWQVFAVTVDHGLRPEAAAEAVFVADFCASQDIPHETVKWTGWDGQGNLQDQARRARYRLIADWATRHDVTHLVLGHTADDQAETFLMRLARSAGVDGLAAMRRQWEDEGLTWVRPFLHIFRYDLRNYLTCNNLRWVDDPSNDDSRFDRVKARKAMAALKPLGITAEILTDVAQNLSSARNALTTTAAEFAREHCELQAGDFLIGRDALVRLPYDIFRRVMVGGLRWVSGADYAPRAPALHNLHHSVVAAGKPRTLSGCRITVTAEQVRVSREHNAVRDLSCPTTESWDSRWHLIGPHAPDLTIRALGAEGLKHCPDWRETGLPRTSLLSSPAVWRGGKLISAPMAEFANGWQADLVPERNNFVRFLLSH